MANTLINGSQLASAMIGGLVDAGVLTNTAWKDPEFNGVAGKGDVVNVRRLAIQTAANFAGTATPANIVEANVAVTLDHQPYVQQNVTSTEAVLNIEDFFAQVLSPGLSGVAEYLDGEVSALLTASTTTPVTAATAKATLIAAREALTESKVPLADRYLACSPQFISAILGETWVQADTFDDGGKALKEAIVGKAFGFTIVESTHIVDDVGATTEPSAYAYHKSGVIMASRMPNPPQGGADSATAAAYGMGARVVYGWDNTALSDVVTVDTLAGFARAHEPRIVPVYIA